jgi:hypothetical protein
MDGPRFRICGSTSGIQRLGETLAASFEKAWMIFLISSLHWRWFFGSFRLPTILHRGAKHPASVQPSERSLSAIASFRSLSLGFTGSAC